MDSSTLQWLSVSQTLCEQGSGRGGMSEGADQEAATMGCDQGSLSCCLRLTPPFQGPL